MPAANAVNPLQAIIDGLGDPYRCSQKLAVAKRRLIVLCDTHWDVNILITIYRELSCMGTALASGEDTGLSDRLQELQTFLKLFIESGNSPGQSQIIRIRKQIDHLSTDVQVDVLSSDKIQDLVDRSVRIKTPSAPNPDMEVNGLPSISNIPAMLIPPADYLPFEPSECQASVLTPVLNPDQPDRPYIDPDLARMTAKATEMSLGNLADQIVTGEGQYDLEVNTGEYESVSDAQQQATRIDAIVDDNDAADMSDDDILNLSATALSGSNESVPDNNVSRKATVDNAEKTTPAVSPARGPAQPIIYFLHHPGTKTESLEKTLSSDHEVHCFSDPEEFREVLGALAPDALLIEARQGENLDLIAPLLQRLREKQNSAVPLIAICDYSDLSQRLHLMRAGADAVMRSTVTAKEIRLKLDDLLQFNYSDPYRILIVEDDRSQGMFAETILRKSGMQTRLVPDAMNVLEALNEFRPDLILMDLHMPDVNGLELTTIIRENSDFIDTPIVFLSGENDTDTQFDALRAGGDDFLSKPIRPRHLMQAVTNRAQRARSRHVQRGLNDQVSHQDASPPEPSQTESRFHDALDAIINDLETTRDQCGGSVVRLALHLKRRTDLPPDNSIRDLMADSLKRELKTDECSEEDEVGRFLLLIPGDDFNQTLVRVESIKQSIMSTFEADSLITEAASICLGVCELTGRLTSMAQAIEKADQAWQQSLISESTQQISIIRSKQKTQNPDSEFEHQVVNAIKERRLKLLFQPMVGLKTDIGECYHGLVRLENENGDVIPAGQFLPIAEKLGVHKKLDQWVFFKSLAMIANRKRLGQPVNLMINQSPWVFSHSKWVEWVQEQILKREVDPLNVIVEFKLPAVIRHRSAAIDTFDRLMDIGVQLSLGQFTATDSAFELIEELPVHYIKLPNAAELQEMTEEPVSTIVARLHERGQKTIIPGIEDAATAADMWTSGADYLQGNFIQEPDFRLDFEFSQHR